MGETGGTGDTISANEICVSYRMRRVVVGGAWRRILGGGRVYEGELAQIANSLSLMRRPLEQAREPDPCRSHSCRVCVKRKAPNDPSHGEWVM